MTTYKAALGFLLTVGSAPWATAQAPAAAPPPLTDVAITVKLMSPISTDTSHPGDSFSALVMSPDQFAGAAMEGHVQSVQKAQGDTKSQIVFAFETLTSGDSTRPITADLKAVSNSKGVKNVDEEGRVVGQSTQSKKLAGAGAGAVAGGLMGGFHQDKKTAASNSAKGAVAGYVVAVAFTTSGNNMEFAPGSQFVLDVSDRRNTPSLGQK